MADLFNGFSNPSNDYINPGLSPCAALADESFFTFVDGGVGIIEGSKTTAKMDYSKLRIPVNSWSQQSKILQPGEVTYIPGLTKGLCYRQQGFLIPTTLNSTDEELNPYFMQIDLSINYYNSFQFTFKNIEASSNYSTNTAINTALNLVFKNQKIQVTATYDPSILIFKGKQEGYDFTISNVKLTLIDASQNSSSPFVPVIINNQRTDITYTLEEDASYNILYAKYPNGASQGVVIKNTFPTTYDSSTLDNINKWIYLNHVTDLVSFCQEVSINSFVSNVSDNLYVGFDNSTSLGIAKPVYDVAFNVLDVSLTYDVSVLPRDISTDASIHDQFIDTSIVSSVYIFDSSINDSSLYNTNIIDSSLGSSKVTDSYLENGYIIDTSLIRTQVYRTEIYGGKISLSILQGDPSLIDIITSTSITDSSLINYSIESTELKNNYISDSSLSGIDASNNLIVSSIIRSSRIEQSELEVCRLYDSSIWESYINMSTLVNVDLNDSSAISVVGSSIGYVNGYIQDSSLYTSILNGTFIKDVLINQGSGIGLSCNETFIQECSIGDSSIIKGSIISNKAIVSNSYIENSWVNAYRLLVYTNPSTGVKEYQYVTEDDTIDIDSSLNRVTISNSEIWDASINNADLIDCSIYRCYLEDVSLSGCTIYNSNVDISLYVSTLDNNRIILIDPSIHCLIEITYDSSIFYRKVTKRLDVGTNGCSFDDIMSGADYLQLVNTNGEWKKVGDLYMWTSAPDDDVCTIENLVDGFYLYNPHDFNVKVDYLIFV